jgi:hypothetical protein
MKAVVVGLVVVLGLLGGFYGGLRYGEAHAAGSTPAVQPRAGLGGGRAGFGGVSGRIVSAGDGTITVHDASNNKDVTVKLGAGVTISKVAQGTTSDLTQNANVTVIGQTGSDGTVTARTVQVGNAAGRRRASPSPSSTP